jgi:hypothetical protein
MATAVSAGMRLRKPHLPALAGVHELPRLRTWPRASAALPLVTSGREGSSDDGGFAEPERVADGDLGPLDVSATA